MPSSSVSFSFRAWLQTHPSEVLSVLHELSRSLDYSLPDDMLRGSDNGLDAYCIIRDKALLAAYEQAQLFRDMARTYQVKSRKQDRDAGLAQFKQALRQRAFDVAKRFFPAQLPDESAFGGWLPDFSLSVAPEQPAATVEGAYAMAKANHHRARERVVLFLVLLELCHELVHLHGTQRERFEARKGEVLNSLMTWCLRMRATEERFALLLGGEAAQAAAAEALEHMQRYSLMEYLRTDQRLGSYASEEEANFRVALQSRAPTL